MVSDPITQYLTHLQALAAKATPAPWTASEEVPGAIEITELGIDRPVNLFGLDRDGMAICSHRPDAAFIAALDPEMVQALLACVEAGVRCAERGCPCSHCDLGYDEDTCSCFDATAETKEHVAGLAAALAALAKLAEERGKG